jgi:hypothetical protein
MPSPTYQQNKKSILRWQAKNADKVRENSRILMNKLNAFRRESLLFRMILID